MLKILFHHWLRLIMVIGVILALAKVVFASGPNFNDTTSPAVSRSVNPNFSVNVGIGSATPGQTLDVQGTVRMSGNVGIGSSVTDSNGNQRLTLTTSTFEINLH